MRILAEYQGLISSKSGHPCMVFIINNPHTIQFANELPKGFCELEVNKVKKTRSLSQNAMLWKLIGDISFKLNGCRTAVNDTKIYTEILKNAGAKTEVFSLKKDALDEFIVRTGDMFRAYSINHEWKAKSGEWWVLIHAYYGSSAMTTEEMSRVIEEALKYASEAGIDTEYWKGQFYG